MVCRDASDCRSNNEEQFEEGDLVLLDSSFIVLDQEVAMKLQGKFIGPFKVLERLRSSYRLELPEDMRLVHPVFHKQLLRKYRGKYGAVTEVQGEVEKIFGHKSMRGETMYKVKLTTLPITNLVFKFSHEVPAELREKYWANMDKSNHNDL